MSSAHQAVTAYWAAVEARDWETLAGLVAGDVFYEVPQTRERVRGREAYVRFCAEGFPGEWHITVERAVGQDQHAATWVRWSAGQAGADSDSPNWPSASVHQRSMANPAADSSAATPSGRNLADTSVRISSPSANGTVSPIPGSQTICRSSERSRISIHSWTGSHTATWSKVARSKFAPSRAFSTASTFLLKAAVIPAASS